MFLLEGVVTRLDFLLQLPRLLLDLVGQSDLYFPEGINLLRYFFELSRCALHLVCAFFLEPPVLFHQRSKLVLVELLLWVRSDCTLSLRTLTIAVARYGAQRTSLHGLAPSGEGALNAQPVLLTESSDDETTVQMVRLEPPAHDQVVEPARVIRLVTLPYGGFTGPALREYLQLSLRQ